MDDGFMGQARISDSDLAMQSSTHNPCIVLLVIDHMEYRNTGTVIRGSCIVKLSKDVTLS